MVLTKNDTIFKYARAYHDHGHAYNPYVARGDDHAIIGGFNYRMTELQGAIGIVQLKKLDYIINSQRKNKLKILKEISNLPLDFRKINDPGEIGDAIIFYLPNKELTSKFTIKMREKSMSTKNLPDALNWHFSAKWKHLFSKIMPPGNYMWDQSQAILERSVALPIMVNMTDCKIEKTINNIKKICKDIL